MWCYWAKITSIPLLLNPVEKYKWIMYFNVGLTNSFIFFSFQWLSYTFVIFSFATSSTLKVCECTAKVGRVLLCWEIWLDSLSIENEWRAVHPTFNWPKRASTSGRSPAFSDIDRVLRKTNSLASAELLHDSSAPGLDRSCRTCWSTSKLSSAGIYRCADWAAAHRLSPSALCKKE